MPAERAASATDDPLDQVDPVGDSLMVEADFLQVVAEQFIGALFDLLQEEDGNDAFMSDLAFHSRISSLAERSSNIELTDTTLIWIDA